MPALSRDDLTPEGQAIFDQFRVWHDAAEGRFIVMRGDGPYVNFMYQGLAVKFTQKAAHKEMARRRYWACWKYRKPCRAKAEMVGGP